MKATTILVVLATSITSVTANCYGGNGPSWTDVGAADRHAHNACYGYTDGSGFHKGALQNLRFTRAGVPATVCNNNGGSKIVFQFTAIGRPATLAPDTCYDYLRREIVGCNVHGGESVHDVNGPHVGQKYGWWVRASPEAGNC